MDPLLGEIKMFAGDFAPRGWALCNGQSMSVDQFSALFSILGTYYGGDGYQTFNLPDLRSRAPVHSGQGKGLSNYPLGQPNGSEATTLGVQNMPAHSHLVNSVANAAPDQASPAGTLITASPGDPVTGAPGASIYSSAAGDSTMNPKMIQPVGGGLPFSMIQPVLAVNFIIATDGIYPSRP